MTTDTNPPTDSKWTIGGKLTDAQSRHSVIFHNADNEFVGELDFSTSKMKFKGDAEESAQVFINWVDVLWSKRNERSE